MDPKKHVCLTVFTSAEARYWLTVPVFRDIMCTNLQPSIWLMISRGSPQTSRPQRGTWFSAVKKQRRTSKYCGACKLAFPHQCKQVRQDNQPSKMTLQKLLPKQSSSTILELSACVGPEWATWVSNYHLVMTNIAMETSTIFKFISSVNHLFLWAIYTMAMFVITRG